MAKADDIPASRFRDQVSILAGVALGLGLSLAAGADPSTQAAKAPDPPFVEVTEQVGVEFVHWNGMSGELYFSETPGGGGALFDYDNDGDLDLYLVQGRLLNPKKSAADATTPPPGPLPLRDRLLRNELISKHGPSGTLRFVDVTESAGLDSRGYGMGVTAGDYDNDGWTDLYVTNFGANMLWRNRGADDQGRVTFEDATAAAGVGDESWSVPALFVDLDADGRLDLYVGNYLDFSIANHKPCFGKSGEQDYCGPSAYPPVPDRLFRNLGPKNGTVRFEDVGIRSGLSRGRGGALGVVSGDFDGDGGLDLYVANDQMANHLWTVTSRKPLKVEDLALFSGCAVNGDGLAEASMGVDAGDVDNDGDDDLFMAHLTQETNTLYLNDGTGFFEDQSAGAGLALPSFPFTGFGTRLVDFDNDGLLDVVVVNGAIKTLEDLARKRDPFPLHQTDQIFRNVGGGRFEEITDQAGDAFKVSLVSRGLASGDLDNDGDSDLVIFNNHGPTRILRNEVGHRASWIGLDVRAGRFDRPAIGSRVTVLVNGQEVAQRQVRVDGSYASANDPRILLGLGSKAVRAVDVRVRWWGEVGGPSEEIWKGLSTGTYHRLVAGQGKAVAEPTAARPAANHEP